jgi:hypothetical protein
VEMKSDVPTIGKQFLYLLFFVAITDNRNNWNMILQGKVLIML